MITQIVLHAILIILGVLLVVKSFIVLKGLNKKTAMYYLSRRQVRCTVIALVTFGIIYIALQVITFFKNVWIMPLKLEEIIQYGNEGLLIAALIYLIFKFKKK